MLRCLPPTDGVDGGAWRRLDRGCRRNIPAHTANDGSHHLTGDGGLAWPRGAVVWRWALRAKPWPPAAPQQNGRCRHPSDGRPLPCAIAQRVEGLEVARVGPGHPANNRRRRAPDHEFAAGYVGGQRGRWAGADEKHGARGVVDGRGAASAGPNDIHGGRGHWSRRLAIRHARCCHDEAQKRQVSNPSHAGHTPPPTVQVPTAVSNRAETSDRRCA